MSRDLSKFIGYFGPDDKVTPVHDPGVLTDCLVCCKPLKDPKMQIGGIDRRSDKNSYFFRAHKACWARLNDLERADYIRSITDHDLTIVLPSEQPN